MTTGNKDPADQAGEVITKQYTTSPEEREELPKDILKVFLRAEKYFRQYQNADPTHQSEKWWTVIKSFDEVLGLMDTIDEYINQQVAHSRSLWQEEVRNQAIPLLTKHSSPEGWTNTLEIGYKEGINDVLELPALKGQDE